MALRQQEPAEEFTTNPIKNESLLKMKNAADIQFIKVMVKPDSDSDYEYEKITETIPEMIATALKFASDIKDLEYHKEDRKIVFTCPTTQKFNQVS